MNRLLTRVFAERQHHGRTDLEAVETGLRAALHQAGSAALTELLRYEAPSADQCHLPCPCGHHAHYQGLRSKPVLTVVGPARVVGNESHGQKFGGAIPPDMMRWLRRDGPVSTNRNDM